MVFRAPLASAAIVIVFAIAAAGSGCTCSKAADPNASTEAGAGAGEATAASVDAALPGAPGGLSAPIAAAHIEGGDVVVAGLDVPAQAIRVQRIDANDGVVSDHTIFEGVKWSSESELKMAPAARGVAVTWRGLRNGKLVRQMLLLGPDLAPRGEVTEVAAASCATRDALWFTDGKRVHGRPWSGTAITIDLPRDRDAALVCGQRRAFALLDEEDGTSVLVLGGGGDAPDGGAPPTDARGAAAGGKLAVARGAVSLLKE